MAREWISIEDCKVHSLLAGTTTIPGVLLQTSERANIIGVPHKGYMWVDEHTAHDLGFLPENYRNKQEIWQGYLDVHVKGKKFQVRSNIERDVKRDDAERQQHFKKQIRQMCENFGIFFGSKYRKPVHNIFTGLNGMVDAYFEHKYTGPRPERELLILFRNAVKEHFSVMNPYLVRLGELFHNSKDDLAATRKRPEIAALNDGLDQLYAFAEEFFRLLHVKLEMERIHLLQDISAVKHCEKMSRAGRWSIDVPEWARNVVLTIPEFEINGHKHSDDDDYTFKNEGVVTFMPW